MPQKNAALAGFFSLHLQKNTPDLKNQVYKVRPNKKT